MTRAEMKDARWPCGVSTDGPEQQIRCLLIHLLVIDSLSMACVDKIWNSLIISLVSWVPTPNLFLKLYVTTLWAGFSLQVSVFRIRVTCFLISIWARWFKPVLGSRRFNPHQSFSNTCLWMRSKVVTTRVGTSLLSFDWLMTCHATTPVPTRKSAFYQFHFPVIPQFRLN